MKGKSKKSTYSTTFGIDPFKVAGWTRLELATSCVTGMEQNNDLVGRVALRRLCDMLNRNPARGGESVSLLTLVPPTWIGVSSDLEKKM